MAVFLLILRDRRVQLLGLTALLALVVGLFSVSPAASIKWVVKGGYWVLLVVFVLFVRACWISCRDGWRDFKLRREVTGALCLIGIAGSVLVAHERYGFKILADEVLLLGTSMGIHYDRHVAYPVRASDIHGPFLVTQSVLDKRPFFFPFLISFAHDLTGYRPANGFYFNTALTFFFLALVYALGRRIARTPWGGGLGVLLFAGLPLLSQQTKGNGFELLNLTMIAVTMLLAIRFAERRDEPSLEAVCLAGILLAFTRYESVVFLLPLAVLVGWVWCRERRIILTWPVIASPLPLIIYLLQNKVFAVNPASWELASRPDASSPFGLHYVPGNLGHALAFFFDTTGYQPNSPLFAALGLLALPFFALWCIRIFRAGVDAEPWRVAIATISVGLFAVGGVLMGYFWGQFDHPLIHRLSLPVHLLMLIAITALAGDMVRGRLGWQLLCGGAVVGLVAYSLPAMSQRAYAKSYSPAVEMEWRDEFLKKHPERDYLFIDNDSTYWISHMIPATPAKQARERKEGLIYHLRNHSFSAMYVFQRYIVEDRTGEPTVDPADDIGPDFELETVWERRIQTMVLGRISRITAIREGDQVAVRPGFITPVKTVHTKAELEKAKDAFVDRWLKQLP